MKSIKAKNIVMPGDNKMSSLPPDNTWDSSIAVMQSQVNWRRKKLTQSLSDPAEMFYMQIILKQCIECDCGTVWLKHHMISGDGNYGTA